MHRSTIHNWQNEPNFAAAVQTAQTEFRHALNDDLLDLAAEALATLRSLMTDPKTPPGVRLRAALAVLQRPTYPQPTWNLPAHPESPAEQRVVDGFRHLKEEFRTFPQRMESPLAKPVPRSAPCPCGSGLKYKRCCGRIAPPVLEEAHQLN